MGTDRAGSEAEGTASELTRRALLAGAGAAAAGGAVAGGGGLAGPAEADAVAATRSIGVVRRGRNAIELIGTLVQDGRDVTGYGYLTGISGLPESRLFATAGVDRGEESCRFTFFSRARVATRSVRPELFAVIGTGELAIHFDAAGGADFARPETFAAGARIATYATRLQNVLTVVAPDQAITNIFGEVEQRRAEPFSLAGRRQRLGRRGLRLRLQVMGPGRRTDAATPRATFQVAGNLVVAG